MIARENEKSLLAQVAVGDEIAFGLLYSQWQPQLASFIYRVTKSKELTTEIIQDVFLKIWMSRETLTEINNFKSYLFVVSRNQSLDALKKVMRELRQFKQWEKDNGADTGYENMELPKTSLIDDAIDQLSPRQKEVYLLHRHERLTYQQIASKLGIGTETVKTHLELAIKFITKYLQNHLTLIALVFGIISKKK